MLLSGSIYSWGGLSPVDAAQKLETIGVDCFHVDCNDDASVFDDITAIKKTSRVPIDLHLITPSPEEYFEHIRRTKVEICCFQYEALNAPLMVPENISCRLGLAITMDTSIDVFDAFKDRFAFILLMTTIPGQSGGTFNNIVFQRIREFRAKYPSKAIHVDGGVTDEVSLMLRNHGVSLIVVGSYLEKAKSVVNSTLLIRGQDEAKSKFLVRDFMSFPEEFPVLNIEDLTLTAILQEMSSRRSGFAAIVDHDFKLKGIITDGDIRRGWLKVLETGQALNASDILNRTPQTVTDTATVGEMLEQIAACRQTCIYLPIIDANNRLRGAVSFQDLIRGGI